jgi:hypothetical protein
MALFVQWLAIPFCFYLAKTPLSIMVKRRGKTPLLRVRISMAKTSRFWPVSMSYFCAYLGCTRVGRAGCRGQ